LKALLGSMSRRSSRSLWRGCCRGKRQMYTGFWIANNHIYGPTDPGKFWIQDGYIWGPRNSGQYWIQDNFIWGPQESGRFWIEDGHIYGPHADLPWMQKYEGFRL
jgi:hypothetical protein